MSTLDNFRKEAKRWLKALRAKNPDARAQLARAHPHAPAEPGLRDVQHALAREHGAANWAELTTGVRPGSDRGRPDVGASHAQRVATFFESAKMSGRSSWSTA